MGKIKRFFKGWKAYLWIILGSLITAISINIFMVPYKIAPGGVTGIATVIFYWTGGKLPVGITMLILNVPLFIGGIRFIGGRFTVRTLFSTVLLSVIIDLSEPYTNLFVVHNLANPGNMASTPDMLLYSIFGGFFMGLGLGLVFRSGATTGGTDLAARIVHHFLPHFTMGTTLLLIDSCVIVLATVAFNSFQLGMYAIVTLFLSSKVIDAILEGVNFAKAVYIISDMADDIAQKIMSDLDRGITGLNGTGMYTGKDKKVLYCVIQRNQLPLLKEIVMEIDRNAFVILSDVREVVGEGFMTYDEK